MRCFSLSKHGGQLLLGSWVDQADHSGLTSLLRLIFRTHLVGKLRLHFSWCGNGTILEWVDFVGSLDCWGGGRWLGYMAGSPQFLLNLFSETFFFFQRCLIRLRLWFMFVNTGCYPPVPAFLSLSFNATFSIFGAACRAQWRLGCHFSQAVSGWDETDRRHRSPWD